VARRALFAGVAIVVVGGLAVLITPVRTWILTVVGLRATGETQIDETCEDPLIGSGPLPEVSIPADALRIEVGDSLQAALDEVGEDGTVVLAAGVHRGASAQPQGGQTILGEAGAILAGDGAPFAFRASVPNVTIQGLVIEGFRPEERSGVIHGEEGARGWTVTGNEVRANGEIGVVAKSEWTVTFNRIHHNGRYGITGSGSGLLVQGNEVACNALEIGSTSESGATKFVHTNDLVLSENFVHDNLGNALWMDINNLDPLVSDNRVFNNALAGIFIEISCGGLVTNNEVSGNGFGTRRPMGMNNSGIFVSTSPGVEITQNLVVDNAKGIGGLHWAHGNRQAVDRCTPELRDLMVHGNQIEQEEGLVAGIDATIDGGQAWTQWGNTFFDNEYVIGPGARFRWEDNTIEFSDWQAHGLG
jgi:parallel beta-helix repeat protein